MEILLRGATGQERSLSVPHNATVGALNAQLMSAHAKYFGIGPGDGVILYYDTFRLQDDWPLRDLLNPDDTILVRVRKGSAHRRLPPGPIRREPSSGAIAQLLAMNFDRATAEAALAQAGGDVNRAAALIIDGRLSAAPAPGPARLRAPRAPSDIIAALATDYPLLDPGTLHAILEAARNDEETARNIIAGMM